MAQNNDLKLTQEEHDSLMRENFGIFFEAAFRVLFRNTNLILNWHLERLFYLLSLVTAGEMRRQIFNMPPRTLKSLTISVAYTAWLLGRDPTIRIIVASYGQDIAELLAIRTRRIMESEMYRRVFPRTRFSDRKNTVAEFETTEGGGRLATSVGGRMTGYGANLIILDDAEKASDMASAERRQQTKDWFSDTVMTRLDNPSRGAILVVGQRLHEDDLCSHLIRLGGWTVERLPATADEDSDHQLAHDEVYRFRRNELLHPERLSEEVLAERRQQMGNRNYQAQYQQAPLPAGGSLNYWQLVKIVDRPLDEFEFTIQSWDPAVTTSEGSSYSACVTFRVSDRAVCAIDARRFKLEGPELLQLIRKMDRDLKPDALMIEVNGIGRVVYQQLERAGFSHLLCASSKMDKASRLIGCEDFMNEGRFLVWRSMAGYEEFRKEFMNFSTGKLNDLVDATTQVVYQFDKIRRRVNASRDRFLRNRIDSVLAHPRQAGTLDARVTTIPLTQTNRSLENIYSDWTGDW